MRNEKRYKDVPSGSFQEEAGDESIAGRRINRRALLGAGLGLAVAGVGAGAWLSTRPNYTLAKGKDDPSLKPDPTDTVVVQWNKVTLQAIADTGTGPTIGARALAIVHTCMYDAWTPYDKKAIATQPNGIPDQKGKVGLSDINTTTSYAAYRALMDLFPSEASVFNTQMQTLNLDPANTSTDTTTPTGIGNVAAQAVLTYRHGDGSNQANGYADTSGYVPVNSDPNHVVDPNHWTPQFLKGSTVNVQKFLTPHWGSIAPFALTSGSQFRPSAGPLQVTQSSFQKEVDDVVALSAQLNDTSKTIAEYWSDGPHTVTPPGHWDLFAQFVAAHAVSKNLQHNTTDDIMLFFALTNAIFDASIACWDCKRHYDSMRPVTAVHYLYAGKQISAWGGSGQGMQSIDGSTWKSYIATPAFAEYVSGHSTFSGAGSYILSQVVKNGAFGNSYTAPTGSSLIEPGITPASPITLSWSTFNDAAVQAGMSRRYGGIHFQQADEDGRALGTSVAQQAGAKALAYIQGTVAGKTKH